MQEHMCWCAGAHVSMLLHTQTPWCRYTFVLVNSVPNCSQIIDKILIMLDLLIGKIVNTQIIVK